MRNNNKEDLDMKKTGKRITALSISAMLMMNMAATAIPVSAEIGSKTYVHDGYTVEYKVMNEWTGNQNIEVTITNTGDEILSNWAVGYNARGEINGLWNAQIYGHQGTEYILSGASYNYEIEPGMSTNFGYTLTGDKFKIPQDIVNCAERVDITEGYNVYYNVTGDFGDTYQAEMFIENLSDTDITAWQLSFDGNITINDLWNGKLLENDNGSFKVKNAENNVVIPAGGSTSFSFGGTKTADVSAPVETWTEIVTEAVTEPMTEDTSEGVITIEEEIEQINETPEPETDVTEETAVTEITEVTDPVVETYSDIIIGNYKLTAVTIPMEFDFEIDPDIDSDGDGLYDYIEKEIGTDRYNPDTDGDGLPDGYEYFTLGTDPTKTDSDDNGISDADEDFDKDGLTNFEEYQLGTDPFSKDTDNDGLSDYDEVYIYHTDPLKYDTDGDKVSDGDEIELGLDPNNPATNGYPDNEYTTTQTVGEDSSVFDYINNNEDNPYTVTIEITAAGVAENNLFAGKSGYSYSILQNEAVLGVVPGFEYSEGLSVTDVVIKFKLDDSAVADKLGVYGDIPEFDGVNRFQVFKYFEDNNILLPIETFYDETTNTVSTHVDELGTYCLIDMEKWLNYLENLEPGNYYEEDDEEKSANIVFCLDTRDIIDAESFDSVKSDIKAVAEDAFDRYNDVKVYVYYQQFGSNFKVRNNLLTDYETGNNYFTSYEEAEAALDTLERYMIKSNYWAYDLVEATNFMIDTCDENIIAMYHITADDRVMGSIDEAKQLIQTIKNSEYTDDDGEKAYRINVSVVCPNGEIASDSYAYELAGASNGMVYSNVMYEAQVMTLDVAARDSEQENNITKKIEDNIIEICGYGDGIEYKVILSTGSVGVIKLRQKLIEGSMTDTDEDGLSDWEEVNIKLIAKYANDRDDKIEVKSGKYVIKTKNLPTILQVLKSYEGNPYTDNAMFDLMKYATAAKIMDSDNWRILPICSNPTNVDSDGDGIVDCIKYFSSEKYGRYGVGKDKYYKTEFNDPNPLKFEYLWQWPVIENDTGKKLNRVTGGFIDLPTRTVPHGAIDITRGEEDIIVAAYDGEVVGIERNDKRTDGMGLGNYIYIKHLINGQVFYSRYAHLKIIFENINAGYINKEGEYVSGTYVHAGDEIAIMGGSGGYKVHLDFQIGTLNKPYNEIKSLSPGHDDLGNIIDPILFDKVFTSQSRTDEVSKKKYNMLLNIPNDINDQCHYGYSCNDCKKYFDCTILDSCECKNKNECTCCIKHKYEVDIKYLV